MSPMATAAQWIEGARPRTLPNAVAPVLVGAGLAAELSALSWLRSGLALLVSLALIIGVNFANDYSDGVRGTDDERTGPQRLVGSGVATARSVLTAAWTSFAVAAVFGLVLVALSGRWWLLAVGAVSIGAAWFYTGGSRPYGYSGLGELAAFTFFGPVAVLGTVYVQAGTVNWESVVGAVAVGAWSAAVLVANNLRDIPTDRETGKHTVAVRLGDTATRRLWLALVIVPFVVTVVLGPVHPLAFVGVIALVLIAAPARAVLTGYEGEDLIPVLRDTGMSMLAWAALTGAALGLAG
ncbi:1,4-dihydroxy-2-naphthoate polyprenyltransferase [Saccharomonospora iraqiensis]|uniref:1,4-dihydroxy-2-naphthoate polyprenyltransferase n=1 Tax=Saccharomonospora iraqiensis TaxID=52698 RepID=UPI00047C909D